MRAFRDDGDAFWQKTRQFIEGVYSDAGIACRGTFLTLPLMNPKTRKTHPLTVKNPSEDLTAWVKGSQRDATAIRIEISYLDNPPAECGM
jgi:hypothetical protein